MENFDFERRITTNGVERIDGVIFSKKTFKSCDNSIVPIVYHNEYLDITFDPSQVMGQATLENREDGVYAKCKFFETFVGNRGKKLALDVDNYVISFSATGIHRRNRHVTRGRINLLHITPKGVALTYKEDIDHDHT